ncbi:MAG: hypothetical protein SGCHY_002974 [Lobulomycetales sp.]
MDRKVASASVGSLLVALTTTPFDVLKTRQQSGHLTRSLRGILKLEGPAGLYRGIVPSIMMTTPATVLYYVGYDTLRDTLPATSYRPLLAGTMARFITVLASAPLEFSRTLMQSDARITLAQTFSRGPARMFRGLSASLLRDVPFSGMYWLLYENARSMIAGPGPAAAFICGAGSGIVAAAVTTPFDVVKTRIQTFKSFDTHAPAVRGVGVWDMFGRIYQEHGVRGLFAGLGPRVYRVAPACAVMITAYEAVNEKLRSPSN